MVAGNAAITGQATGVNSISYDVGTCSVSVSSLPQHPPRPVRTGARRQSLSPVGRPALRNSEAAAITSDAPCTALCSRPSS